MLYICEYVTFVSKNNLVISIIDMSYNSDY